jgi:hypothetical protein
MKTRKMNRAKPTSDTQTKPPLPSHPVVQAGDVDLENLTHPRKVVTPAREVVDEDAGLRLGGRRLVPRMDLRGSIRIHRAVHDVGGLVATSLVGAPVVLALASRVRDAGGTKNRVLQEERQLEPCGQQEKYTLNRIFFFV